MTSSEQQSFLRKMHVVLLLFSHLILSKCTSVHCYTVAFSSTGRSGITSAIKSSSLSLSLSLSPPRSKSYTTFLSQRESRLRYSSLSLSRLFSSQNSKHEDDELSELEPTSTSTSTSVNKNQNPTQSATTKKTTSSKSDSKNKNDETNKNKNVPKSIKKKRRKMELSWCGRESCTVFEDGLREKVVGEHNEILFESPATGQVAYQWSNDNDSSTSSNSNNHDEEDTSKHLFRVLILIKWDDDELLMAASEAVHELTSKGDVVVMLPPDSAAKLKHYYGVDNDKIQLFDPNTKPHPRNLDKLQSVYKDDFDSNIPDLVCTLGGDGLLMYASNLFPGPCPPILCVAGGSLGFLTPFRRDEMVDCIRKSLGLKVETDDDQFYYDGHGESNSWYDDYAPEVPPYMASRMKPSYVDEDGITWTGSYRVPRDDPEESRKKKQTKFGSNNQIYISTRMRLECLVINREGVVRAKYNVLNEVVIDRGSSPYLAALECFCDNVHLTTVQADGIIFSTPTGSTAYSMAAGGSVVHPAVPAILVTPICPHVLSFRSMVFPDHVILRCYVPEDARADASVAFDGKHRRELQRGDSVQMQMSSYPVPTINRRDHSEDWLTSLKRNFNFNTRIRQSPLQNKHE